MNFYIYILIVRSVKNQLSCMICVEEQRTENSILVAGTS